MDKLLYGHEMEHNKSEALIQTARMNLKDLTLKEESQKRTVRDHLRKTAEWPNSSTVTSVTSRAWGREGGLTAEGCDTAFLG